MKPISHCFIAYAQPPLEHVSRDRAPFGLAASSPCSRQLSPDRSVVEYIPRSSGTSQLGWSFRRLHRRSASPVAWPDLVPASYLDGRRGLDLDAFASRRVAHPSRDGNSARFGFSPRCLWPLALALAVVARRSGGRRSRSSDGGLSRGLSECSGRVAGCGGARGVRSLLRIGHQLLGRSREHLRALGHSFSLARSLACPARRACRRRVAA